jgi:phage tail sheath protein FI
MPEYLSPGVYIEEFEIGARPIEGVSTSTLGVVGLTERGRASGLPELVTGFSDFQRKFGGYLGSDQGDHRYLPYAVDAFFRNGGQRAYVMRVLRPDATLATGTAQGGITTRLTLDTPEVKAGNENARKEVKLLSLRGIESGSSLKFEELNEFELPAGTEETHAVVSYDPRKQVVTLDGALGNQYLAKSTRVTLEMPAENSITFSAKDKGAWGNRVRIEVTPVSRTWTSVQEVIGDAGTSKQYRLKSASGFYKGAIVQFEDEATWEKQYRRVEGIEQNTITLDSKLADNAKVTDTSIPPERKLSTCEFRLVVSYRDETEVYEALTTNPATANYYYKAIHGRSGLIDVDDLYPNPADYDRTDPFNQPAGGNGLLVFLSGGNDGTADLGAADYIGTTGDPGTKTGIKALEDVDDVSIIAVPGSSDLKVQNELINQCELLKDRFAILDAGPDAGIADVQAHREQITSKYAALYYPWIRITDPLEKIDIFVPPSGSMAGIYARSDTERGVHKAPANEKVRGALDVKVKVGKGEQDILNPKGINCIRPFPGRGIVVWGGRTISDNTLWKYVNVRRLFNYIEESIEEGTQWVVFEPNDEKLWARVRATITQFLTRVWKDGALMGKKPEEAFFVRCDRSTMTQDDIDNGRLICVIGIAPVKPAEFVIFRIAQWQGGSAVTE